MQRFVLLISMLFLAASSFAQTRYKDELFSIQRFHNVLYGKNYDSKNQLTDLWMDVYTPTSDTATHRPIIFFVHGGSFVGGDRQDQAIDSTARYFAKKGYVTANIEYRLEQTTFIDPIINFADTYNWHRAIARATQDLKAAIRYFKRDVVENNNSYGVDTNRIYIYGSSAGAIATLHAVFLDDTIEMNPVFKAAYKDVGGLDGNSGNPGHSMDGIRAVISNSGAVFDLNCINNNTNIEYIGFHHTVDFTVPFDIGCFVTVACWLGNYYGDNKIFPRIKNNGTYAEFYPIDKIGHPADQINDSATYSMILQKTTDFLFRNLQQDLVSVIKKNTVDALEIYPNPSNGNFNIVLPKTLSNQLLKMDIADITGKIVFSKMMLPNEFHTMNLSLENGMYVVSLFAEDQVYVTKLNVVK